MITEATVSAPQGLSTWHWHSIDWSEATRQTRKLQMRIAKAVKDNRQPVHINGLIEA